MANPIYIYRGDDRDLNITFTNAAGAPLDITGYSVWFTAKTDPLLPDGSAILQSIVSTFTSPTSGTATIPITHTQTSGLVAGQYYYDIQYKTAGSKIYTAVNDFLIVTNDVTKAA